MLEYKDQVRFSIGPYILASVAETGGGAGAYLHPPKVNRVHDGTLEEFDGGKMSLKESFQLQVRGFSTNKGSSHGLAVCGLEPHHTRTTLVFIINIDHFRLE